VKRTAASLGLVVGFSVLFLGALLAAPQRGPWSARAAFPAGPRGSLLVTNSGDSGPGTLRQALLDAQAGDVITFDPAVFPPGSPVAIALDSPLPSLGQGFLTIDASDAGVILDGSGLTAEGASGLAISSNGNTIRGLQVVGFPCNGIELGGGAQHNVIGGDRSLGAGPLGQGNLLSGNAQRGIVLGDPDTSFNTIVGNYIGTDLAGTAAWGNGMNGLHMNGASYNDVSYNVISGNDGYGMDLYNADHNTISHNDVGTGAGGATPLGNRASGITMHGGASHNTIGPGNVIAHNEGPGLDVREPTSLGNTITQNSIYSQTQALGIGLSEGGNAGRAAPLVKDFDLAAGTIVGYTCAGCKVEVFSDAGGEGKEVEGKTTADGQGRFSFDKGSALHGPHLTATVTDSEGNTSPFSNPTSGASGSHVFQQGNPLPYTQLYVPPTGDLPDNRIGTYFHGLWPADDFSDQVLDSRAKRVRLAINALDAGMVDWDRPELSVDPAHDALVTNLAARGVAMTYVLSFWDKATYPGGVGAPCPRFQTEQDIQHYLNFVQFIVGHFKDRIEYYELWNEPDAHTCPQWIEVADYVNLVKRVAPVIKAEYPQAKIQVGAVSGLAGAGSQAYLFGLLNSDAMPLVDVISWHPFYEESPEHNAAYYYGYPGLVQDIKDTATAHGFEGGYEADEITYQTPDDPNRPPEQLWSYEETVCAKYYARGIVRHLGMDVTLGLGGTGPHRAESYGTIQNLGVIMAGAEPVSLPLTVQTTVTDVVSYTFSLPDGAYLVALWRDGIAVESAPGVTATLRLTGQFAGYETVAVDPIYGFRQEMMGQVEAGSLVLPDLVVRDYPLLLRLYVPRYVLLPAILKGR
jgi:parallel beta-helix repeat protein